MTEDKRNTLTIGNKEIPIKRTEIEHLRLKFYPENPRIYSLIVSEEGEEPDQEEIEKKLSQMDHVRQLIQSIKANGGIIDPLIVRDGDFVVLEGNSRLAAYRVLAKKDPIRWGKIKCDILPDDITDDAVAALLGEYHIVGRKDWAPYEQAGHLWRRHKKHGVAIEKISGEIGISEKKIRRLIGVYDFMVENKEQNIQKWSYYDEYMKSRFIQQRRKESPDMDKIFVKKVKKGIIPKAEDVRDKLTKICRVGGKTLTTFLSKESAFEECYENAVKRGADNPLLHRLKKFRELVIDQDIKKELMLIDDGQYKKCLFELKKILQRLNILIPALQKKRGE